MIGAFLRLGVIVQEFFGLIEGILTLGWALNGEIDRFSGFLKMMISNWPEGYRILNAIHFRLYLHM